MGYRCIGHAGGAASGVILRREAFVASNITACTARNIIADSASGVSYKSLIFSICTKWCVFVHLILSVSPTSYHAFLYRRSIIAVCICICIKSFAQSKIHRRRNVFLLLRISRQRELFLSLTKAYAPTTDIVRRLMTAVMIGENKDEHGA